MVYNSKTFEIYHKLTEEGEIAYKDMLEKEADKILYKNEHPILYKIKQIGNFLSDIKDKYIK